MTDATFVAAEEVPDPRQVPLGADDRLFGASARRAGRVPNPTDVRHGLAAGREPGRAGRRGRRLAVSPGAAARSPIKVVGYE
jgi:hypothetical protein